MNSILEAQKDMRLAYYDGAPGIVSSGAIWLVSGVIALSMSSKAGIMALIFGGMLIFPISVLFCKVLGLSGKHQKDNPLGPLALEGTVWMLLSIPIAIAAALYKAEWFFPAMMLIIAGRYLTFSTLYGNRIYWLFAAVLVAASILLIKLDAPVYSGAFSGAVIEIGFGLYMFYLAKSRRIV